MNRVASLDGLRGIAILLVIAGHCWEGYGSDLGKMAWLAPIFANSSLGVRLFFVLSGYLITTLLLEEWETTGTLSLRKFYARRALRIFPAFYTYFGCIVILVSTGILAISTPQLIAAATYTWNYLGICNFHGTSEGHWFLGHLWTLSLEEQFYLFWPAILLLLGSKKSLIAAVSLVALMPAIRIGFYFAFPGQRGYLGMLLHTAIDSIMMGCVLALAVRHVRLRSWLSNLKWGWLLPASLASMFLVSPVLSHVFGGRYSITAGITLDALAAAFIIFNVSLLKPDTLTARALSFPPLVFIGRLSYSWYLWQQLFLTPLNHTWSGWFPINLPCSFFAALVSNYLIEHPFLRLKNRFSSRPTK